MLVVFNQIQFFFFFLSAIHHLFSLSLYLSLKFSGYPIVPLSFVLEEPPRIGLDSFSLPPMIWLLHPWLWPWPGPPPPLLKIGSVEHRPPRRVLRPRVLLAIQLSLWVDSVCTHSTLWGRMVLSQHEADTFAFLRSVKGRPGLENTSTQAGSNSPAP